MVLNVKELIQQRENSLIHQVLGEAVIERIIQQFMLNDPQVSLLHDMLTLRGYVGTTITPPLADDLASQIATMVPEYGLSHMELGQVRLAWSDLVGAWIIIMNQRARLS